MDARSAAVLNPNAGLAQNGSGRGNGKDHIVAEFASAADRKREISAHRRMAHRLVPPDGYPYLSPRVVVSRLESEFAYVEADEEDGRRHVRGIIRQLQKIRDAGLTPVDEEYLDRLKKAQRGAVYVYFGDDPGSEIACLSTAVIPGEALFFDYASRAHEQAARPLLVRCARALGYEIVEA
jgi:hypothetical protein